MTLGDLLHDISEAGLTLRANEGDDALCVSPAKNLTPQLVAAIKEHKEALVRVALEDERFRKTGVIQNERQVFELAREWFGCYHEGRET